VAIFNVPSVALQKLCLEQENYFFAGGGFNLIISWCTCCMEARPRHSHSHAMLLAVV
jgi:hypothetical protein